MPLPLPVLRNNVRSWWIVSLIPALLPAAAPADQPKPIFPQEELCPLLSGTESGSNQESAPPEALDWDTVPPQAILTWLLDEKPVRDGVLDADGDGNTLIAEKIRALTEDDYCSLSTTTCTAEEKEALASARERLRLFAEAGGGPGYVIERVDEAGRAQAATEDAFLPRDLVDGQDRSLRVRCVALPEPIEAEMDDNPYWHRNGDQTGGFRLVGDIDNLSKSRASLGAVKAAQLSITSDLIEDETAYRVNAVAGYAFEVAGGNDVVTSFIPFLSAERVTSGDETQIDTLGAGFQQAITLNWPGPLRSEFAITPIYETDSDFDSHTGTLKFRWTPALAENAGFPLGFPNVYGPVELRFGLDLLADAGRVFDDGGEDNLDGEGTFLRFGKQASMQVRGAPGSLFRPIELQIANRYLYNVDTAFEHINQFDAALAFLFPDNENYQLSIAYSNGRDDNSLELYEFWQTQFGVRF